MKLYKIKKSKIDNKGRGLYATRDIKEGTKIIDYVGKIITNKEVEESNGSNDTIEKSSMTVHVDHACENGDSWETHYSENHGAYYVYNSATHETRWLS